VFTSYRIEEFRRIAVGAGSCRLAAVLGHATNYAFYLLPKF
jgi:hypothetical protein